MKTSDPGTCNQAEFHLHVAGDVFSMSHLLTTGTGKKTNSAEAISNSTRMVERDALKHVRRHSFGISMDLFTYFLFLLVIFLRIRSHRIRHHFSLPFGRIWLVHFFQASKIAKKPKKCDLKEGSFKYLYLEDHPISVQW